MQVALAQARFVADRGTVTDDNRALIDRILAADPQQAVALEILALDAFRKADYATAARHLQNALAGGGAGPRTDALKQGLERARDVDGRWVGPSLDVTIDIGDAHRGIACRRRAAVRVRAQAGRTHAVAGGAQPARRRDDDGAPRSNQRDAGRCDA